MALITLKDIGKIYVSEANVSVGIRGVNLSFDRGEFVAITGKSGSGKSTLLNVISGVDTYEEGELFIEGNPTSHYIQSDWEKYRQDYISFIFQDYNIIDSFTVLQNVELALLHIENAKERRKRALELIEKVGMTKWKNHKGSHLSGGQKQRTVIARALAKDSPIILADEPTGNLDSATGKEIISLLKEVSKDKLLIVVTHNFDDVEQYATRHVRIFDGAVDVDHVISAPSPVTTPITKIEADGDEKSFADNFRHNVKNGFSLGFTVFKSKPKLSVLTCFILLLSISTLFLFSSVFNFAYDDFWGKTPLFNDIDGRVVLTKAVKAPISESELQTLKDKYGAESYMRYDFLLDYGRDTFFAIPKSENELFFLFNSSFTIDYNPNFGDDIYGRYPEKPNEVFFYVPIGFKTFFDGNDFYEFQISCQRLSNKLTVTGLKYFYDNTKNSKVYFTKEGFEMASLSFEASKNLNATVNVKSGDGLHTTSLSAYSSHIGVDYSLDGNKICISREFCKSFLEKYGESFATVYLSASNLQSDVISRSFDSENVVICDIDSDLYNDAYITISPDILKDIEYELLESSYMQSSLFFDSSKKAKQAINGIKQDGYIAVTSDATHEVSGIEAITYFMLNMLIFVSWLFGSAFIFVFSALCISRIIKASRADMGIMRSMGINTKVIKISVLARILICLVPVSVLFAGLAIFIYTFPPANLTFPFLHFGDYLLIFVTIYLMCYFVTERQVEKTFRKSVKESLRGGVSK